MQKTQHTLTKSGTKTTVSMAFPPLPPPPLAPPPLTIPQFQFQSLTTPPVQPLTYSTLTQVQPPAFQQFPVTPVVTTPLHLSSSPMALSMDNTSIAPTTTTTAVTANSNPSNEYEKHLQSLFNQPKSNTSSNSTTTK